MPSASALASVVAGLSVLRGVRAGFDASSKSNVAVYWGQNSYGQGSGNLTQQRLSYYCSNPNVDLIPMAFLTTITDSNGYPEMNFANQGDKCSYFNGTQTFYCAELEEDITACQQQYNKTIILSIGGATYTEGGFASASEAEAAADMIWATFGPQSNSTSTNATVLRPFGAAQVDGFDFDFESTTSNMQPFAARLRADMDASEAADGRHRILTAAPQCPFPDAADNAFLSGPNGDGTGAVQMDAVLVQFYNNYCGLQSYVAGQAEQSNFNFATWDNWAATLSANKAVKVLLGVPASATAAGSGYKSAADLAPIIAYARNFSSFGGVMMWDMSQAYANSGFLAAVKGDLTGAAAAATTTNGTYCNGVNGGGARRSLGFAGELAN